MRRPDSVETHWRARALRARYARLLLRRGFQAIGRWARDWGRAVYATALAAG